MGAKLGRRFLKQPAEKLKAVFVASVDYAHKAYVYIKFDNFQTNHCGTCMKL